MIILSNFAERLDELIFDNNLNTKKLSEKTGIKISVLNKYKKGTILPSVASALKLANLFNCSIDYLLGISNENYNQAFIVPPLFCEQLKFLLNYFNVTQYRLFKYGKFPQSAVQNWIKGTHVPSLDNVVKLAAFFDCTVDFVLGREQ